MRFLATLLSQAIALAILGTAMPTAELAPYNGLYLTTKYLNGTVETTKLDVNAGKRSTKPAGVSRREATGLRKRYAHCHTDANLDASGTDTAVQIWKNSVGSGSYEIHSDAGTAEVWAHAEGVKVYYCLDQPRSVGYLDLEDINYALWQMDHFCARYTASFWHWDGAVEIFGKGRLTDNVC